MPRDWVTVGHVVLTRFGRPYESCGGSFGVLPTAEAAAALARAYNQGKAFSTLAPFTAAAVVVQLVESGHGSGVDNPGPHAAVRRDG